MILVIQPVNVSPDRRVSRPNIPVPSYEIDSISEFVCYSFQFLRIIAPTEKEWIESGKIVCDLVADRKYDVNKTREIHLDVLIALTARRTGAYLVTCNSKDFIAIQNYVGCELICW